MKKLGIFCLLFMIALSSCRDNIDDVNTKEDPYVPPIVNYNPQTLPVNGSITGFVADEAGEPIADADVKVGTLSTTTDDFGHFFFNDITLNANGTVVTVKKAGYFAGSRRFYAVENERNRVKVEMLTKTFSESFNATDGAVVATNGGASVTFAPNSIKKADGTIYNGTVRVAAKWLDPADPTTLDQMPGNLQGVNVEVEEVVLGTYGMIAVELESDAGESLNISEGNTATLSMPVPANLQGGAPAEIPLWTYNEDFGIWVEEGKATLENGVYTGEVSHFSFWNCDYPYPLVTFEAVLQDNNGNPLPNYKIAISLSTNWGPFTGVGYTCPDGSIEGLIPANEDLVLEIIGLCGEVLYSQNIGPFADDTDLGVISIDPSTMNVTIITGELIDCDDNLVTEGVVKFSFDNTSVYEYVTGGTFSSTFSTCDNSTDVEVIGIDLGNLKQSDPVTTSSNGTFDVGQIKACDIDVEEYIRITVDDGANSKTLVYTVANVYQDSTITGLGTSFVYWGNNPGGNLNIYMQVDGLTAGDYSNSNYVEIFADAANEIYFGQGENFSSFIIDTYGNVGELVEGTFGGTMTNFGVNPPMQVTVTGDFSITRQ